MNITTETSGDTFTVKLDARLDPTTSPSLDAKLALDGMHELGLDFAKSTAFSALGFSGCSKRTRP
jgi:hypothetical protein